MAFGALCAVSPRWKWSAGKPGLDYVAFWPGVAYRRRVKMLGGLWPRSAALDVGIGVAALALSLIFGRHAALSQPGTRPLDAFGYVLVVVSCVAVVGRRVAPVLVLGVVVAALVLFAVFNYPGGPLLVPVMVAVYSAGTALERPAVLGLGAMVTGVVVARAWLSASQGRVSAFTWAAPGWVLASLAWGAAVRSRRQLLESVRLRAELAEQSREAEAQRRADQERLRIARDLHDVIGHSFAAVNVQARVAGTVLETDRAEARLALTAIESISREALKEIRRALGVLREGGQEQTVTAASLTTRIGTLLEPLQDAGIRVEAHVDIGDASLPRAPADAVYRVVQESLTNVMRHAAADAVRLRVAREGGTVKVEITNDGARPAVASRSGAGSGGGHGLLGMRERVTALGGQLHAGPEGGGFKVTGMVPVDGGPS
jgi:signal transduction histidine kinase